MKLLCRILFACLLAPLILAQAQHDGSRPPSTGYHITGKVVDYQTLQPLSGVEVGIGDIFAPDDLRTTVTVEDGRFYFGGLNADKYNLWARGKGEVQGFEAHGEFMTAIAVGPGLDPGEVIFRFHPDSSISGRVTDEHNEPVRDANIKLFTNTNGSPVLQVSAETTTDDQGSFRFAHLNPGRYCFAVLAQPWYASVIAYSQSPASRHEGGRPLDMVYPVIYYPGGTNANFAAPIVLGAGERFSVDISLQPVHALSVRFPVSGSDDGHPVNLNLVQRLAGGATESVWPRVRQVSPGILEVSGIGAGDYQAVFTLSNPQENGSPRTSISRGLEVLANGATTLDEENRGARVQGIVKRDDGGVPPKGGTFTLRRLETNVLSEADVSQQSEFGFNDDLGPGKYELASDMDGLFIRNIVATGAKVMGSTIQIDGNSAVKLVVTMTPGAGSVTGTALKQGKPLAGAMIVLVPADAALNVSLIRRDQSDSDGTFTLQNVVSGKYKVLALENSWDLEWSSPEVLKPFMTGGTEVQVHGKETPDVKVNVQTIGGAN